MSKKSIVSIHELAVAIYERENGTVIPFILPDHDAYTLRSEGITDVPLAVRVVQVLRKLFQDGLLQQVVEEAHANPEWIEPPLPEDAIITELDALQVLTQH